MGLLDSLLNMAAGSTKATKSNQNAVSTIMEVLIQNKQSGGLDGLIGTLTKGGLGNVVDSWISTGKNKSVKTSQLNNVLSGDLVSQIASRLGISKTAALGMVAKFLPLIIDKLTPDGKVTAQSSAVNVQDILGKILKR
ncbi:MAG: Protein of unknown function bacterial [Bacteroidetes bacterium]|nr:Protein of unknown function bacterial [Bacteroidota bacterium]